VDIGRENSDKESEYVSIFPEDRSCALDATSGQIDSSVDYADEGPEGSFALGARVVEYKKVSFQEKCGNTSVLISFSDCTDVPSCQQFLPSVIIRRPGALTSC
jgi:hypothetical protein